MQNSPEGDFISLYTAVREITLSCYEVLIFAIETHFIPVHENQYNKHKFTGDPNRWYRYMAPVSLLHQMSLLMGSPIVRTINHYLFILNCQKYHVANEKRQVFNCKFIFNIYIYVHVNRIIYIYSAWKRKIEVIFIYYFLFFNWDL